MALAPVETLVMELSWRIFGCFWLLLGADAALSGSLKRVDGSQDTQVVSGSVIRIDGS